MNSVILIGRIANDLELKGNENKVVNFNLAVQKQGKTEGANFIPVAVFGKTAENLVAYQSKGSQIAIQGHINQDSYTLEDGSKRNSIKVIANRVQFLGSKSTATVSEADVIANHIGEPTFEAIDDEDIPF